MKMKIMKSLFGLLIVCLLSWSCKRNVETNMANKPLKFRQARGYAQHDWQMDSVYKRLQLRDSANDLTWKAAISPHDNYKYAGRLYYESLRGINAPTIILIGVAHSARKFGLQDKIIFGDFDYWQSPYDSVKVSSLNAEIMKKLPAESYILHDSMQIVEHSLEAIIPFLQRKIRNVEIVPILVPYINYETIDKISGELTEVVRTILKDKNWTYGKDLAIVISNDAVHYGDQEWSSDNMAPFGTDEKGTEKARQMDLEIIDKCLKGDLSDQKIKMFTEYTVQQEDYKEYKWVWCGRYSVPFGLSLANKLSLAEYQKNLTGTFLGYQTSIDHELIYVDDIGMTSTALATPRHWVAYVSAVYE